ncbi:bifunctional riboflavin kinase/FAD synthetase [Desulforamulus hydrothermalis]|uniref:Riboflavin biosynthesis protein n=1 Tax=Desulforamulus hydrothermalis Lam5 = DSM 18033 TaxID=1121428 RepID=K8E191_9FIRM|nr:bifunctional riboflavin kinase/FAD synthetase [Desulforamulus hydrothermalis]CCO09420.1 Riboflavin biosynthesis protein ribC (Includes: Riboflavin kinase; FMN adenylyltransferase) [Desulforamulus hydrothermalis Lam5 = DSM 18033]SHH08534.1 FMN adenylyltransferase [Desulforamulus hydrothermalis Lam5 = DSM 18033]
MRVYDSLTGLKDKYCHIVAAIGNFDGLHLGHQKLIGEAVAMARRSKGTAAVLTFHPHPLSVLKPELAPPMLLDQDAKRVMMEELGVDVLILLPFTLEFAQLSPVEFIRDVLVQQLNVQGIVVGYNYSFGHRGRGNAETLWQYAAAYGYTLSVIPPVKVGQQVVSSTLIRHKLAEGDVVSARKLLGYPPFTEGTVVYGERRGNTLGFPTANIDCPAGMMVPAKGVYSVHVDLAGETYLGVANVGNKPTFHGYQQPINIEVHLLDFHGNIYGKKIKVKYIRRLRDEKKFSSVTDLVNQIQADVQSARFDHPE